MSSSAARRVAQLNAHLTDAPVDQIQRFPTAAVRSAMRRTLAREGCAIYQGFLCAPPLSSADLAALVAERTETIERVL